MKILHVCQLSWSGNWGLAKSKKRTKFGMKGQKDLRKKWTIGVIVKIGGDKGECPTSFFVIEVEIGISNSF